MNRKEIIKKIKEEKGATAADIVIAASIIILTIAAVSMIYVNVTLGSRNVTRTAGATRIATNILENIEKRSYDEFILEFEKEISGITKQTEDEYLDYYLLNGGDDGKFFSTKIPNGYKLYVKAEPNYGTHSDLKEQFDLVREIKIRIAFSVGDRIENIDFETVKTRDITGEANEPVTEYLQSSGIQANDMYYYPVKFLENSEVYVKCNEEDVLWYNYSDKKWATVIVSRQTEDVLFDVNGKFIGEISTDRDNSAYTEKYVWVPRFFTKIVDSIEVFDSFAYSGIGNNKIVPIVLNSRAGDVSTLNVNTFAEVSATEGLIVNTINFENRTGKWVSAEENRIISDKDANILNKSKYGPYME